MSDLITTGALFESHGAYLALHWEAGQAGKDRLVCSDSPEHQNCIYQDDLVGNMNLSHPNRVQVLGQQELAYLAGLKKNSHDEAMDRLFDCRPAFIIVAGSVPIPAILRQRAEQCQTALFSSSLPSAKIISYLRYYLSSVMAERITLHGVFMDVMSIGVLIVGESGMGKSELALELLTRGHRLIADDTPEFSCIAPDIINGTCPPVLDGFLEVRGLGVLNVRAMFGDCVIKKNKYLRLIIRLEPMHEDSIWEVDRLHGSTQPRNILDVEIPEVVLPVAPGRNLAVLVEGAALNHIQRLKGYDAAQDFIERQRQYMNGEGH